MSQKDERDPSVVFDVRPIPGRVKHAQIFDRWLNLPVGEFFVLLNDHDPVPLRYQFEAEFQGAFTWEYLEQGPAEFRVKITKLKEVSAPEKTPVGCGGHGHHHSHGGGSDAGNVKATAEGVQEIDVRGLEPPEPLVRILDALAELPAHTKLKATTDREPCHLFPEAEQRGFNTDCKEQPDGSWVTEITRA